jgi:hypothetical protein
MNGFTADGHLGAEGVGVAAREVGGGPHPHALAPADRDEEVVVRVEVREPAPG